MKTSKDLQRPYKDPMKTSKKMKNSLTMMIDIQSIHISDVEITSIHIYIIYISQRPHENKPPSLGLRASGTVSAAASAKKKGVEMAS